VGTLYRSPKIQTFIKLAVFGLARATIYTKEPERYHERAYVPMFTLACHT